MTCDYIVDNWRCGNTETIGNTSDYIMHYSEQYGSYPMDLCNFHKRYAHCFNDKMIERNMEILEPYRCEIKTTVEKKGNANA